MPLRVVKRTGRESCVDHIWCNFSPNSHGYIINPKLSDHCPTCTMIDSSVQSQILRVKFRNFCSGNVDRFKENIDREFSNFNPQYINVNDYARCLTDFMLGLSNKYFPIMTKQVSTKRLNSPWMTDIVMRCVNK